MDPAARLDNLSNLSVGRLVGLQHSSVIIYLVVESGFLSRVEGRGFYVESRE